MTFISEGSWRTHVTDDNRAIVRRHIVSNITSYFSSIPNDVLTEHAKQYEAAVFNRSESRTNYLRRIALPVKLVESQTTNNNRNPIPPIPSDATATRSHPLFKPVEEEKPDIPSKLRFAVQLTVFEFLLPLYTCASDEIVLLAQQFETRAFRAATDKPDYRARVALELEREQKESELEYIFSLPTSQYVQ